MNYHDEDCDFRGATNAELARWQGRMEERVFANKALFDQARKDDKDALAKALTAQKEIADKHNDLIRAAAERDKNYVSVDVHNQQKQNLEERLGRIESLGAKYVGGLIVISIIGVANLIKVFGG